MNRWKITVRLYDIIWNAPEEEALPTSGTLIYRGNHWGKEDIKEVLSKKYSYECLDIDFELLDLQLIRQ